MTTGLFSLAPSEFSPLPLVATVCHWKPSRDYPLCVVIPLFMEGQFNQLTGQRQQVRVGVNFVCQPGITVA